MSEKTLFEGPKDEKPQSRKAALATLLWGIVAVLVIAVLYGLSLDVFVNWFLVNPGTLNSGITVAQGIGIYMIVAFLKPTVTIPTKEWAAQPRWLRNWWGTIFQVTFLVLFWISAILVHLILL